MKVILQAEPNTGIQDIVIEGLPFVIGRGEGKFSQYEEQFPDQLKKLSRRHARIFVEGGRLYIEDLGSTNGTFLGGQRLHDQPMPLGNGDAIAFGAFFKYVIYIDQPETKSAESRPGGESTIYVSDASSFLGMLASEKKADQGPSSGGRQETSSQSSIPCAGTHSKLKDKKRLFAAFIAEFWDKPGDGRKRKWYLLGLVGVLLAAGVVSVVALSSPERKLKRLMKQQRYTECAQVADAILREDPHDERVCDIATEALIKGILPDWMDKLKRARFAEAREFLASAASRNEHNRDGLKAIELLVWVTDLEAFFAGRKGETPVTIYRDEEKVESLLSRWTKDKNCNCSLLDQMANHHPPFAIYQRQIHSDLNALKTLETMRVEPTEELKAAIESQLDADRPEALVATVENFRRKYPEIGGIEALQKDVAAYIALWRAVESKELFRVSSLLEEDPYQTKPFVDKVAHIREKILPSPAVVEAYRRAREAWLGGAPKKAIAILQPLVNEKWGELAERKLKHYRQVLKDFAAVEGSRDRLDYGVLLLSFHNILIPSEDEVFLKLIEKDYEKIRTEELKKSQASFMEAQAKWDDYLKGGGISGLLRLDTKVSEEFRRKAGLLRTAFEAFSSGASIYGLLNRELPDTWKTLEKTILDEVQIQRLRLDDLRNVLDPAVSSEKVKLLPNPSERKD
ncbi:MAG: FHA domain-containing protein [Thermodesulfobacteriota bacterium]|nr:FHA domain-containing protein [Thermodesulfobacteriota bacterium]